MFSGAFPVAITGGFFASLTLGNISVDNEAAFIETAKEGGVGIAAAWDAVVPNFREEMRKKSFCQIDFSSL